MVRSAAVRVGVEGVTADDDGQGRQANRQQAGIWVHVLFVASVEQGMGDCPATTDGGIA